MSHSLYGNLNNPGTWSDADVRRRQISQLLHALIPAAAMCVVLTAGPEVKVTSPTTWSSGSWNLLLALVFGVIVWDVLVLRLRRRGRRAPLTVPVDSVEHALRFAEDALGVNAWPWGRGGYVGLRSVAAIDRDTTMVWKSCAVWPLAALACAASVPQNDNAMGWLVGTVIRLSSIDSDDVWAEVAHAVAATTPPTMHSSFVRVMNMGHRQRDSVAVVMRDAVLGASVAVR